MIKYIVLFVCSMVIPLVNSSSISLALMSYKIDFIYSMVSLGLYGMSIKFLKNNKNPIIIITVSTFAEDLIINLLCDIKISTYIIQVVIIVLFTIYIKYKSDIRL